MPRPKKRGFMYFPLDTDFFLDENVKLLRRSYGSTGVLTYINLMCKIYRNGYYYCFDDIEMLAADIAEEISNSQLKHTADTVQKCIRLLVLRGTLDRELFELGVLSGKDIQEQYIVSCARAKRISYPEEYSLVNTEKVLASNGMKA